jgi:glycosyltransferase involved in cell wall biosynthesis
VNIAIFHFGFMYSGGGERHPIYETLYFQSKGHHVECYAPAVRPDKCHPGLLGSITIKGFIPRVRAHIPLRDSASLGLSTLVGPILADRFKQFDVIVSHGQPAAWIAYMISRRIRKPYICYLHQPVRFLYPRPIDIKTGWGTKRDFVLLNELVRLTKPFASVLDHVSVVSANCIFANSHWIGRWIQEIYGVAPLICPPGVDVQKFVPVRKKTDVKLADARIRKPFVLSTNRHYPQKGLEYMILAMPKVLSKLDVTFVLTGDYTRYTPRLMQLAKDLKVRDHILFTNQLREEELIRLYQNADAYVYTPPQEDFGLGPIEAMACGTPPVVWDSGGPAENVSNGITGLKASPYSVNDLAENIVHILNDERLNKRIGRQGREFVERNFPWERHMQIMESVLDELVN